MRLLLVEDSRDLADSLCKVLRTGGYAVDVARDGEEADALLRLAAFDLVILDLGLPNRDGLGVLKRLRARGSAVPVILLTADASLNGRVRGLDEGAYEYLTKPFEVAELEARIRAQLRRASGKPGRMVALASSRSMRAAAFLPSGAGHCHLRRANNNDVPASRRVPPESASDTLSSNVRFGRLYSFSSTSGLGAEPKVCLRRLRRP